MTFFSPDGLIIIIKSRVFRDPHRLGPFADNEFCIVTL